MRLATSALETVYAPSLLDQAIEATTASLLDQAIEATTASWLFRDRMDRMLNESIPSQEELFEHEDFYVGGCGCR